MASIIKQSDNSLIPGQPEYGKGWKAEYNHGCCPYCNERPIAYCTTKTQYFTRNNQSEDLVNTDVNRYCKCQNKSVTAGCIPCNETINK